MKTIEEVKAKCIFVVQKVTTGNFHFAFSNFTPEKVFIGLDKFYEVVKCIAKLDTGYSFYGSYNLYLSVFYEDKKLVFEHCRESEIKKMKKEIAEFLEFSEGELFGNKKYTCLTKKSLEQKQSDVQAEDENELMKQYKEQSVPKDSTRNGLYVDGGYSDGYDDGYSDIYSEH